MSIKCKCGFLEEMHGFKSLGEYERFIDYLNKQVQNNNLIEVNADENYEKGLIYGGKWYRCSYCNEIWRLVQPDPPFIGLWEKVKN